MAWRELDTEIVVPFHHVAQDGSLKPTAEGAYLQLGDELVDLALRGGMGSATWMERHGVRSLGVWCASRRGTGRARVQERQPLRVRRGLGWFRWRDGSRRHGGWEIHELADRDGESLIRWDHKWLFFREGEDGRPRFLEEPAPGVEEDQDIELEPVADRPRLGAAQSTVPFVWTPRETDLNQHVFYRSYLERTENVAAEAGVDVSDFASRQTWYANPSLLADRMRGVVEPAGDGLLVALSREADEALCTVARFARG